MARNKNKKDKGAKNAPVCVRKTSIGGQALMEGIMMRGPVTTSMAVRNTKGEIVVESFPTTTKKRPKILKLPLIRGVVGFIDSMTLGYKCLMRSAEISGLEEIEAEMAKEKAQKKAAKKAEKAAKKAAKSGHTNTATQTETAPAPADNAPDAADNATTASLTDEELAEAKKESSFTTGLIMVISVVLAVVIMIGLFFLLPVWLYELVEKIPGYPQDNRFLRSIFESVVRILIMIGYMGLMCLMKDTRRTFQFHGAEHKTIFCYEHGLELTVENVRKERRFHPRCGTSFLVLMLLVGIVVGFFIPATLPRLLRVALKLLLMPVVMGIGYELIKICGKHDNWLTRIIAAPGLAFQRITVLEPDDAMIECAITAIKNVIPADGSDLVEGSPCGMGSSTCEQKTDEEEPAVPTEAEENADGGEVTSTENQ